MGTRTAALPISMCTPAPPDQILRSNPAVPIAIAALVIAVVDSTIIAAGKILLASGSSSLQSSMVS